MRGELAARSVMKKPPTIPEDDAATATLPRKGERKCCSEPLALGAQISRSLTESAPSSATEKKKN
jgi:hypothetical protein